MRGNVGIFWSATDAISLLILLLLFFFLLLERPSSKKSKFPSFQIGRGRSLAGMNMLQINTHRLTESDFWFDVTLSRWRPWRHFTYKSDTIWWVHTKRLSGACAAVSGSSLSIVHSYLLYSYSCVLFHFSRQRCIQIPLGSPPTLATLVSTCLMPKMH